ncbi:MFS transporter [Sphingomonas montanisoli]|nr:MFS transporter [Sphingomonas montanisoli]
MPRRLRAIAAICCGTALVILDAAIPVVALPTIGRELHVPASSTVLTVTIYQLTLVMAIMPLSAVGDMIGLRRLYALGLTVFALAAATCLFVNSFVLLLFIRFVQALGAAAVLSMTSALIRSIYPSGQLGRGLGVNSLINASFTALAPTVGGYIVAFAPWQWVFAASAPLGVLALIGVRNLPDPEPRQGRFGWLSAAMSAATFGLIVGGLETGAHGGGAVATLLVLAAGIGIGVVFVRRELRVEQPVMPVDMLASPALALAMLGAMAGFMAMMTFVISMPFRLETGYHFSAGEVGTMMATWPLAALLIGPFASIMADRFSLRLLSGIGASVTVLALLSLAMMPADVSPLGICARLFVTGGGISLYLSPNARALIASAPRHRAASAGGLFQTVRLLGQAIGATVAAALLSFGLGSGPGPAYAAATLATIAGLCSVVRIRR